MIAQLDAGFAYDGGGGMGGGCDSWINWNFTWKQRINERFSNEIGLHDEKCPWSSDCMSPVRSTSNWCRCSSVLPNRSLFLITKDRLEKFISQGKISVRPAWFGHWSAKEKPLPRTAPPLPHTGLTHSCPLRSLNESNWAEMSFRTDLMQSGTKIWIGTDLNLWQPSFCEVVVTGAEV